MTQYLKKVTKDRGQFSATFTNGEKTDSYQAACFFMVMQDKGVEPEDLAAYIKLGGMTDPLKPWDEIRRIAATFSAAKPGTEAA